MNCFPTLELTSPHTQPHFSQKLALESSLLSSAVACAFRTVMLLEPLLGGVGHQSLLCDLTFSQQFWWFQFLQTSHLLVCLLHFRTVSGVMSNVGRKKSHSDWELTTMERRYSVPPGPTAGPHDPHHARGQALIHPVSGPSASEDLHAWSIYR